MLCPMADSSTRHVPIASQFLSLMVKALDALQGHAPAELADGSTIARKAKLLWFDIFKTYGTHYVTQVGALRHTRWLHACAQVSLRSVDLLSLPHTRS